MAESRYVPVYPHLHAQINHIRLSNLILKAHVYVFLILVLTELFHLCLPVINFLGVKNIKFCDSNIPLYIFIELCVYKLFKCAYFGVNLKSS